MAINYKLGAHLHLLQLDRVFILYTPAYEYMYSEAIYGSSWNKAFKIINRIVVLLIFFLLIFSIHAKTTRVKARAHAFLKTLKETPTTVVTDRGLVGLTMKVQVSRFSKAMRSC